MQCHPPRAVVARRPPPRASQETRKTTPDESLPPPPPLLEENVHCRGIHNGPVIATCRQRQPISGTKITRGAGKSQPPPPQADGQDTRTLQASALSQFACTTRQGSHWLLAPPQLAPHHSHRPLPLPPCSLSAMDLRITHPTCLRSLDIHCTRTDDSQAGRQNHTYQLAQHGPRLACFYL